MAVGLLTFTLYIPGARSLKDKRRVVRSLKDRLHRSFNVSVAEIDYHDRHGRTELGVAVVSNSDYHCREVLEKVLAYCRRPGDAELTHHELELIA